MDLKAGPPGSGAFAPAATVSCDYRNKPMSGSPKFACLIPPDDELKVFATLRGPFFALWDDALLTFRQYLGPDGELRTRRLHPIYSTDRSELDCRRV